MVSQLASKWQGLKVGTMKLKLKTSKFEASEDIITKLNHKFFISLESNIEKLVGVATLPPSFLPSGAFYRENGCLL